MSRRSSRALAYIPLLMSERPESVLVVGFGVGHTGQAAAAYPTVRRVEIVDPSREVLAQAGYFKDANGSVLTLDRENELCPACRDRLAALGFTVRRPGFRWSSR
jgi:protein-L-isoaspartate O-methyltransferase